MSSSDGGTNNNNPDGFFIVLKEENQIHHTNKISKSKVRIMGVALLFLMVALAKTFVEATVVESKSPFKIILDGGSTGSRLHVFEFVQKRNGEEECIRRGSTKANVPISSFGSNVELDPAHVAEHMIPLFEFAAGVIPRKYHEATEVKYAATAGMRLLDEDQQDAVYTALHQGLTESNKFVFKSFQREDLATLDGQLEGFFGAVAANYLHGIVDTNLKVKEVDEHDGPIGALDMGGSSTQIVFLPQGEEAADQGTCELEDCLWEGDGIEHINGDDFFATSYLSYGVDQFRNRLWNTLINEKESYCNSPSAYISYGVDQIKKLLWSSLVSERIVDEGRDSSDMCMVKEVENPCANKGFVTEFEGFHLVGTGNTEECIRQTQRLIPHPAKTHDNHASIENQVGGVKHPPVRGKFLAMSLYYFSLDSLRAFSKANDEAHQALNLSWPNPSIEELHNALDGLCSREWHGDMATEVGSHSYTREEVLPHRCMEAVYMVTLLKDGYGFHPESRDITFTFDVDGSEVEWTLGMALSMNAANAQIEAEREEQVRINTTHDTDHGESLHITSASSDSAASAAATIIVSSPASSYVE
jgi:apyrase